MSVPSTFPAVYVEEAPHGVRSIEGVATSITAFVGRALRGPADGHPESPVRIFSFADYELVFGGLWGASPMSFAVQHYFQNGGREALIVRVHNGAVAGTATIGGTTFTASNPGAWGSGLRVRIDAVDPAHLAGDAPNTVFTLGVKDLDTGRSESHANVSMIAGRPRFVGDVLRQSSVLLRGPTTSLALLPPMSQASSAADPFTDLATSIQFTGANDGAAVSGVQVAGPGLAASEQGLFALEKADLFNLLCIPPFAPGSDVDKTTWDAAVAYAVKRRAIVIIDPPYNTNRWTTAASVSAPGAITEVAARNSHAAIYFPRITAANSLKQGRPEAFAPCGAVAGVIARTDSTRGVWKSPAGTEAILSGVQGLELHLSDQENGAINPLGVNCLRNFAATGPTVWGARTLDGADSLSSEWKYLAVRRLGLFLEESLDRGTRWVVFEPNGEPLWAQIRLSVGAFMHTWFRAGAFQGFTPKDAYFVRCDGATTTQGDIDDGVVNIIVGFAPLKPAEFVLIKVQQRTDNAPA